MKSIENSNTSQEVKKKMTLRDHYYSLPDRNESTPRIDLIRRVAKRCDVPISTARSWLVYGIIPRDTHAIEILQEETGIAPEDMWERK